MIVSASTVVAEARSWVGAPYRHQGRARTGVDCVGLPIAIMQELGALPEHFEITNYGRTPTGELAARLVDHCIRTDVAVAGTLLVIAWTKIAAHVAIFTGDSMIHAYESVGRVVEHGYRGRWVRMTHSIWRIPDVIYE
jgi:cell wall-associated NlpC family hydrolase